MLYFLPMRKYLQTDPLIYKNIQTDSDKKVVFLSGLGLDIRKQREGFLRRYALNQGVSYLALDYTKFTMENPKTPDYNLNQTLSKTLEILAQDNKKLFLYGACYGGLMALQIAAQIPERVGCVLAFSPPHETEEFPWADKTIAFLIKREKELERRKVKLKILQQMILFRTVFKIVADTQGREKIPTTFKGPVHILHGQNDKLIPVENSAHVQRVLDNPNCILHISPATGHGFQNDFKMENPIRLLDKHLRSL